MQLSERTVEVLTNFSTINNSILVKPGNLLRTVSQQKTVMVKAEVAETFQREFAIYDLKRFLGVLSLFKNPDLTFSDKFVTIESEGQSVKYVYADPSSIGVLPPTKEISFPTPDVEFVVKQEQLTAVLKAGSVLQMPEMAVVGKDGVITLRALNSKDPSADEYK